MKKKALSIFLAFAVTITMMPMTAIMSFADTTKSVNVNSTESLQAALDSANEPTVITLAEGDYDTVYLRSTSSASRIMSNVTIKGAEGKTVNVKKIASQIDANHGFLDIENLVIDGLTFSDDKSTGVWFDYNDSNGKGQLRVNGLTVQNCKKTGSAEQQGVYEMCGFIAGYCDNNNNSQQYAGNETLSCGYHNIKLINNILTDIKIPIWFGNNGPKSEFTIVGNTFDGCKDNHIQISNPNGSTTGNFVISGNVLKNMDGRFARIAGASADASFAISNNIVSTPVGFDTGGDGTIYKISGNTGFVVTETENYWPSGDYTSEAKTTWQAMGIVPKPIEKSDDVEQESSANVPSGAESGLEIKVVEQAIKDITDNTAVTEENATNLQNDDIQKALKVAIDDSFVDASTQLKITIKSVETTTEETQKDQISSSTITTTTARYDVKPTITVIKSDGSLTTTENRTITNAELAKAVQEDPEFAITFRLAVPASMQGDKVLVSHYQDGQELSDWSEEYQVKGDGANRYIEVSATSFSTFELQIITAETAVAKIVRDGVPTYFGILSAAINDVKNNETITLLKDNSENITVDRVVSFTINNNGNSNNASISAGDGYTLEKQGGVYTFTEKIEPPINPDPEKNNCCLKKLLIGTIIAVPIATLIIKSSVCAFNCWNKPPMMPLPYKYGPFFKPVFGVNSFFFGF